MVRTRARALPAVLVAGVLVVLLLAVAGCAVPHAGRAFAAPSVTVGVDPAFIAGTDGGDDDRLAAAVLRDLQTYWAATYPTISGGAPFRPLTGSFSVDSSAASAPPPCADETEEVEGNAYYCPRADVIAYDRAALLPVLRQDFGDAAVVVVLAHEFGHAVQQRLLAAVPGPGAGYSSPSPTILLEGQADCYGAAFLRQVHDGRLPDLRTGAAGVDAAMGALVTFRDPVGTGGNDATAHGNSFDRVTSFQIGYEDGPGACTAMTTTNRLFTQRAFTSLADSSNGGNLPLPALLTDVRGDLDRFYGGVVADPGVAGGGRPWTPPVLREQGAGCGNGDGAGGDGAGGDGAGPALQGPVAFCPADRTLRVDPGPALTGLHRRVGDYASATLVASREGLAALDALGRPTTGPAAGRAALCLAGAYTASVGGPDTRFSLSPGDLDEAVSLLLTDADPARGSDGALAPDEAATAYARVGDFRRGVTAGARACLG